MSEKTVWEELRTGGRTVVETICAAVREGNVRRVVVRSGSGESVLELPVTLGVLGAALLPAWIAAGLLAALVTGCKSRSSASSSRRPPAPALRLRRTAEPGAARQVGATNRLMDESSLLRDALEREQSLRARTEAERQRLQGVVERLQRELQVARLELAARTEELRVAWQELKDMDHLHTPPTAEHVARVGTPWVNAVARGLGRTMRRTAGKLLKR